MGALKRFAPVKAAKLLVKRPSIDGLLRQPKGCIIRTPLTPLKDPSNSPKGEDMEL